jgi:hypothetical protein
MTSAAQQGLVRLSTGLGIVLLLIFLPQFVSAQNSKIGTQQITLKFGDTLRLENEYVVPHTEKLFFDGKEVPFSAYQMNYLSGTMVLRDSTLSEKDLSIRYRYFPEFLDQQFAFRTFRITRDTISGEDGIAVEEYDQGGDQVIFFPSSVRKSGSISRGLSVGNNQNLSVTSGLRLQLEGDLGDDLKLQAAITDENIPIQPDGTTQQINDFDKVFIQLLRGDDRVILGDFEINHKGTNFANFYRNVQGIGFRVNEKNFNAGISGAVAKGKFHTNSFQGQEGVQGPYRLGGKSGERFIIVLAGSEKVYINGELMVRGESNDYVMDYNTGELRFTSQRIINSAVRIVVDFEYTDRYYNRSLFFTDFGTKLLKDRLTIRGSFGRDADNPNAPVDGEFSPEAIDSLRAAGDSIAAAFVSGIDSVGPPENESSIHYLRNDTLIQGVTFERYIFSNDPELAIYRIVFSNVGPGNGTYIREQSLVNGTVFRWVPPDSSLNLTGDYAPIRPLVPASVRQVADIGAEFKVSKHMTAYTEMALSSVDLNRQSPVDDQDNVDFANKTGLRLEKLRLGDSLDMRVDVSHRIVGARFENIDRVYKVEYGREWNFDDLGERELENVSEGIVEIRHKSNLRLLANAGIRTYGDRLFSFKQLYEGESSHKILQGKYTFTTITTEDNQSSAFSRWTRHNGDIFKTLGKIRLGSEVWMENKSNEVNGTARDGAFRFRDFKPYFKTVGLEKLNLHLYYNYRKEHEVLDTLDRDKSVAHTGYMKVMVNPFPTLSLQNTSSYRRFRVLDNKFVEKTGLTNNQTLITNFQGSFYTKNRLIFSNLIYEVTSEQVGRRQIAYVEVFPGQGDYEWFDLDSNGVQDLDEFQYTTNANRSNFFVRVLVPTTELFPSTALNFSGNLKLELKRVLDRSRNPLKEFVRNISSVSNFRVAQKKAAGEDLSSYIVNIGNVFADTSLLEAQYTLRQDLYFFRNNPVGDLKFSYADNQTKLFLVSGAESRSLKSYGADQRLNFGKNKSLENEFNTGNRRSSAETFSSRNFDIDFIEVKPKLNFQISRKFRLSTGYEFKHKENTSDADTVDAVVNMHKIIFDAKLNLKERNNIFAKLELVNIAQVGTAGFSAEYELRETLQPGFNAIWQVFTTYYITKSLELSLTYDGRSSQGNKVLHTGRVQLKAFF